MDYTTDGLISSIKRRIIAPTNNSTFTKQKYVDVLNSELKNRIVPIIMSVFEEFFVANNDTTIVSGTYTYTIPITAVGDKLRDITIWDLTDSTNPRFVMNVPRLNVEQLNTTVSGFYPIGNTITIYPASAFQQTNQTMRMSYYRRQPELVPSSPDTDGVAYSGKITNIASNVLTLDYLPSSWVAGSTYVDIISQTPRFANTFTNVLISAINTTNKTITIPSGTGIIVNDYACATGQTVFANIPIEWYEVLAQAAGVQVLRALGDSDGMKLAKAELTELITHALDMTSPRIDGEVTRITTNDGLYNFI